MNILHIEGIGIFVSLPEPWLPVVETRTVRATLLVALRKLRMAARTLLVARFSRQILYLRG
jgi:hypothetical protein